VSIYNEIGIDSSKTRHIILFLFVTAVKSLLLVVYIQFVIFSRETIDLCSIFTGALSRSAEATFNNLILYYNWCSVNLFNKWLLFKSIDNCSLPYKILIIFQNRIIHYKKSKFMKIEYFHYYLWYIINIIISNMSLP
jgi:hypothetical protein